MTRYYEQRINNMPVQRRLPPQAITGALLIVLASGLITIGFIYAIHQRADAVEYGYQTQRLIHLREKLEQEKRRLQLDRAYYRSPQVIEQSARKLGLVHPDLSRLIITVSKGKFRRWNPPPKNEGMGPASARGASKLSPPTSLASDVGRSATDSTTAAHAGDKVVGSAVPTRDERRKAIRGNLPASILTVGTGSKERIDQTPTPWLAGVLEFPEGEADLKLEKGKKREKRRH